MKHGYFQRDYLQTALVPTNSFHIYAWENKALNKWMKL